MLTLTEWFASGDRIKVPFSNRPKTKRSADFHIFCRVAGSGPWLTFLHGFPTCSWDWAKITESLSAKYKLLMFDFLGFGDSDKPGGHAYSIMEQADMTEALWRRFEIKDTGLIAHDYGDSVALELLSRQREGKLSTRINKVVLLNGGIYVEKQRPLRIQKLLQKPIIGAVIANFLTESIFRQRFSSIFSEAHPVSETELRQHWQALNRRAGRRRYHRIGRYLKERRQRRVRWEGALENPASSIRFLWGLADPVSGKNVSDEIRKRNPGADLLELENVGHYPQLEVPDVITAEICKAFNVR